MNDLVVAAVAVALLLVLWGVWVLRAAIKSVESEVETSNETPYLRDCVVQSSDPDRPKSRALAELRDGEFVTVGGAHLHLIGGQIICPQGVVVAETGKGTLILEPGVVYIFELTVIRIWIEGESQYEVFHGRE